MLTHSVEMKEEKENMILKFFSYFIGPVQFVMEVSGRFGLFFRPLLAARQGKSCFGQHPCRVALVARAPRLSHMGVESAATPRRDCGKVLGCVDPPTGSSSAARPRNKSPNNVSPIVKLTIIQFHRLPFFWLPHSSTGKHDTLLPHPQCLRKPTRLVGHISRSHHRC